jgi:transcription antitermination factor NusG
MDYFILSIKATQWRLTLSRLKAACGEGEVLCPLVRKETVRPRRKQGKEIIVTEKQMFLGYIAASIPDIKNWYRLAMIPGVSGILCADERPIMISRDKLRGMLSEDDDIEKYEGKLVRIIGGYCEGMEGIYQRGSVNVQVFGQNKLLRIHTNQIVRIETQKAPAA